MGEKIVLLDGHSILNRAFYGLPDLSNAEGLHTNAVYGFLNILFRLLEEEKPDYLTAAFDVHAPTFRHDMYKAYKGTRKPMPEELREQVPLMQEVLRSMGIPIVTKEGYEADDILGTLARQAAEAGLDVSIVSGDRDMLQLATDRVLIRIPKTKGGKTVMEDYYADDVQREWELSPAQIIELKALMGDSADNIPGLPGVGQKTATKILQAYGTIENARAHTEEIKPRKAMEAMRDHFDLAELSKKLAAINTDCPVQLDLESARVGNLYTQEAYDLFRRLEFRRLLPRFEETAGSAEEKTDIRILTDREEIRAFADRAAAAPEAGAYLLADMDRRTGKTRIAGLALAIREEGAIGACYIPAGESAAEEDLKEMLQSVAEGTAQLAVYGLKEMLHASPRLLEAADKCFDIRIAAYLLNPLANEYPCDTIAGTYTSVTILSAEEIFQGKKKPPAEKMSSREASLYAGQMAYTALAAKSAMEKELEKNGMRQLFAEIEMPLVFTLASMESCGIRILPEKLEEYGRSLEEGIATLESRIYEQAGETFNINSPKQLGEILFEKMKLPGGKKTKTGFSTAADVLEKLAPEAPIVSDILEYRTLTKLKSTYADGLAALVSDDGRIHSTFHQTITATGRISSADPNLQNIPVRMELGRQIRKVFVPEEGCVFLDADYSQIELRVLAHMSGDEKLIAAYRSEKDIHAITASQVFHVPFDEVTPLQRRNAKAVNFGIVYGISSFGLSEDLGISRKEAADYIEQYYRTYPGIRSFLEGLVEKAKTKGYSETLYGRRRPMPELKSGNFMQRQFGERVAKNAPIQGTAADIIKIAMIRVSRRLRDEGWKSRLILQVHDELLIEAPEDEAGSVGRLLTEEMMHAADLAVRLEVDMHIGHSWYEAK